MKTIWGQILLERQQWQMAMAAALWLYKATNNEDYLGYVINNAHNVGGIGWSISEFSWDVKYAGIQIIASMVFEFADKHRGAYSSSLHSVVCPFYCDNNGYQFFLKTGMCKYGSSCKYHHRLDRNGAGLVTQNNIHVCSSLRRSTDLRADYLSALSRHGIYTRMEHLHGQGIRCSTFC